MKPAASAAKPAAGDQAGCGRRKTKPSASAKPASASATAREPAAAQPAPSSAPAAQTAPIPGYDDLSVASLRARLRGLDAAGVQALLDYEKANARRDDIWHDGKAYGISYSSSRPASGDSHTSLMVSDDGIQYRELVPNLFDEGTPTEATVRFDEDGTMYCLQRRDGMPRRKSAMFGASRPPYTEWKWHDLGMHVGGPNFIRLPSGQWIAAGRFFHDKTPKTELASLDVEKSTIEPILSLPSGGDTSYPGLVWHDNVLWVSYYSSHEGKTNVYLAKVSVE